MRTKYIVAIGAAIISVAGIGMSVANADDREDHMQRKLDRMSERLNLSEEQEAQLRSHMAGGKDQMKAQRESRREIQRQLMQLDPGAADYQDQLSQLVLKAQKQTEAMILARAEQKEKLHQILTPEQEAKFAEMRSQMQEKMEKRGDRHGGYGHHGEDHRGKGCR
ncbi:Spy/CpxP family protein refolding chaperone [Neptuniibacter halophilus]|uniref:Spy/CpxP family protein refolding chaperone n=1 Tax=Neptuniibacter halophilus TaxID=651666 RepID=UPI002573143C|nr:Spy/CpxP family protein refolding chaperone [Neptuniibacter halophilus]